MFRLYSFDFKERSIQGNFLATYCGDSACRLRREICRSGCKETTAGPSVFPILVFGVEAENNH
jgi:hypothetical protein